MNRRDAIAALTALPIAARISVAQVKPDDVIIIEVPGPVSMDIAEKIREHVSMVFGGRKVLVLGDDIKLRIAEQVPADTFTASQP